MPIRCRLKVFSENFPTLYIREKNVLMINLFFVFTQWAVNLMKKKKNMRKKRNRLKKQAHHHHYHHHYYCL